MIIKNKNINKYPHFIRRDNYKYEFVMKAIYIYPSLDKVTKNKNTNKFEYKLLFSKKNIRLIVC